MSEELKSAVIIGNGTSRKFFNLEKFTVPTFGCNYLYKEFQPTYLVAIDDPILEVLYKSEYPQHRIIAPVHWERWEPENLHGDGRKLRSNTGINCMREAVKRGFKHMFIVGLDFIFEKSEYQTGNVFAGQPNYETSATVEEAKRRVKYLNWYAGINQDCLFSFVIPDEMKDVPHIKPETENVDFPTIEQIKSKGVYK